MWRYRRTQYFSFTTTFAELPYEMRSSISMPGIWLQSIYNKQQLDAAGGLFKILEHLRPGKEFLIRGIPMFVPYLNRIAMIFCCFHGVEGDAPARAEMGGFKIPSRAYSFCHECTDTSDVMVDHLRNGVAAPERGDTKAIAEQIESLGADDSAIRAFLSKEHGIVAYSRNSVFSTSSVVETGINNYSYI